MWSKVPEIDDDLKEEFNKVFKNPDIKEGDNRFTTNLYNQYVNMELTLYRGRDRPKFTTVNKRLKDANFRPIDVSNDNPILDSRIYEV